MSTHTIRVTVNGTEHEAEVPRAPAPSPTSCASASI